MVEGRGRQRDSSDVPTIASLLNTYRDRTGASYMDMSRKVDHALTVARLQQLATSPPKEFPKHTRTVEALAALLEVPVTTIVLAFAAGLGLPVHNTNSLLAMTLPPGTDNLPDKDRDAILTVARALVDARSQAGQGDQLQPDLSRVQGIVLDETNPGLRVVESSPKGHNGS